MEAFTSRFLESEHVQFPTGWALALALGRAADRGRGSFRVPPPEAEGPPGLHLWSPPANDPPGFHVATDKSVLNDVRPSDISLAFPGPISNGTDPFGFLDRRGSSIDPAEPSDSWLLSPPATPPMFPEISGTRHSWPNLEAYAGQPSMAPQTPVPGFRVKPAEIVPGFRVGVDGSARDIPPDAFGLAPLRHSPRSSGLSSGAGVESAPPWAEGGTYPAINLDHPSNLAAPPRDRMRKAFDQLARIYAGVGGEAPSAFPGGFAGPSGRAAPMGSDIVQEALGKQNPPAMLVGNPSKSPLLPVGDDRHRYVQSRPLNSVGSVSGVGVDDEGREVLIPQKPDNRELDPFEKLKQRGYSKPAEDPGNGSAIVTELRKHYQPNHPNYHRYEFRGALCDLGTPGCSVEAAYDALVRHAVPGGPDAGVPIENEKVSPAAFKGIPGGHVQTFVEPKSRSIIDRTMPNHNFHDGFAQRQIVVEDGKVCLRTFGEGINTTGDRAIANRIMAKAAFEDSTAAIRAVLSPLRRPKAGEKWPR